MSGEFKGTPGPWFRDNSRAIGPKSTEDDQSYGMIIPVGWVEFDPDIEVQVANQNIMAAAPKMLQALQTIQQKMSSFITLANEIGINADDGFYLYAAMDAERMARDVIAEALGKKQ